VEPHTGYVKPGYVVSGFVDFVRVESADWLFHVDELSALADQKSTTDTSTAKEVQPAQAIETEAPAKSRAEIAKRHAELSKSSKDGTKQTAEEFGVSASYVRQCVRHEKAKPRSSMAEMTAQLAPSKKKRTGV
jgi:hypothetical protein